MILPLLLAACSTGCTALQMNLGSTPVAASPATEQTYYVELHSNVWPTRQMVLPLREGMTVQNVLEESNARSIGRSFEIDILRIAKETGAPLRMCCEYDVGKQHVKFEQDYAIYPGDRVVIRPKANNPLQQILRAAGPAK